MTTNGTPLLEVKNLSKYFGSVIAIEDVSMFVRAGEVTCLLGDNGAGKSTLIKALSGVHKPTKGEYLFDGESQEFESPREALELGIATVYQDLAMIPLMSIWRNFFLGSEPTKGFGPFKTFDVEKAKRITREEMGKMGIDIRDPDQPVGTLSGGERQSVAIARAVYFGAKVLILDEPTAALGVKQAGVVLKYVVQAKQRGIGVILITHNPHHAYPVGDHFVILKRGQIFGDFAKDEIGLDQLVQMMAGGADLEALSHELESARREPIRPKPKLSETLRKRSRRRQKPTNEKAGRVTTRHLAWSGPGIVVRHIGAARNGGLGERFIHDNPHPVAGSAGAMCRDRQFGEAIEELEDRAGND